MINEEILDIVKMYSFYNKKYRNKSFYIRNKDVTKNKYWKYFKDLYNHVKSGYIVLPKFFEVIFESPIFSNYDIFPNQLTSTTVLNIWEDYINTMNNKIIPNIDFEYLIKLVLNRIETDLKDLDYINRFIDEGGKFDVNKYFELKKYTNDIMYRILINNDLQDIRDIFINKLKQRSDIMIKNCEYNKSLEKKYKYLQDILQYIYLYLQKKGI